MVPDDTFNAPAITLYPPGNRSVTSVSVLSSIQDGNAMYAESEAHTTFRFESSTPTLPEKSYPSRSASSAVRVSTEPSTKEMDGASESISRVSQVTLSMVRVASLSIAMAP